MNYRDSAVLEKFKCLVNSKIKTCKVVKSPFLPFSSAGIGRTGTYIAIDASLNRIWEEGTMDVLGIVTHMRGQRGDMVQNEVKAVEYHISFIY